MPEKIILPKRTKQYLENGATEGQRHTECKAACVQLKAAGVPKSEAERLLFDRGERDGMKRSEISAIVDWAYEKTSLDPIVVGTPGDIPKNPPAPKPSERKQRTPPEHAKWWLSGLQVSKEQFSEKSQLKIPDKEVLAAKLFLEMIYQGTDKINVVVDFFVDESDGKAKPKGGGKTLTRDEWMGWIDEEGVPAYKAGAWFRPNPCQAGTGKGGAITDSDIISHRFLLLESDVLSLETQMALYSKLKLPISAAYLSGGSSVHALVNLSCKNVSEFNSMATRITTALKPFGIDQANKNPSRLSRFPGSWRIIGSGHSLGCEQKLLWLNPGRKPLSENELEAFENSLTFPAIEEKPFRAIVLEAISRYEELNSNPGVRGVPTGIDDFDNDTGGLQNGQMTVIAAETNGGKSSLALNIINAALSKGRGVALFTLEMMSDEISDILFAMNCGVDRSHFNTGRFTQDEMVSMVANTNRIASFPLWSFDDSSPTADQIRKRILSLKSEGVIDLAVVDYVQLITPTSGESNREQQVAGVARSLCSCAKDAKIPIVVLSQLNEEGKLRESRVIGHEAHNVIVIENREEDRTLIMKVIKGRRIKKKDYVLFYEPRFCLIKSMERHEESHYQNGR